MASGPFVFYVLHSFMPWGQKQPSTLGIWFGWTWRSLIHDAHTCMTLLIYCACIEAWIWGCVYYKTQWSPMVEIEPCPVSLQNASGSHLGEQHLSNLSPLACTLIPGMTLALDGYISTPPPPFPKPPIPGGNYPPSTWSHGFASHFCFWHVKFHLINSRALCGPNIYLDIPNFNGLMEA